MYPFSVVKHNILSNKPPHLFRILYLKPPNFLIFPRTAWCYAAVLYPYRLYDRGGLQCVYKGYNPKYVRASWKYLCGLLGWEYRPNKRNGRSREEHLRYLQKLRRIQKEEKEEHIKRLIARGYTKSEIAEMLGMTRRNLNKTYGYLFK